MSVIRRIHHGLLEFEAAGPLCIINDPPPLAVTDPTVLSVNPITTMGIEFTNDVAITNASSLLMMASPTQATGFAGSIWIGHGPLTGDLPGVTMWAARRSPTPIVSAYIGMATEVPPGTHTFSWSANLSGVQGMWLDGVAVTPLEVAAKDDMDFFTSYRVTVGARSKDPSATPATDLPTTFEIHRVRIDTGIWSTANALDFHNGGFPVVGSIYEVPCPVV